LILSSLPEFIESLQEVIEKLKPDEEDTEGEDTGVFDKAFLQEKLQTIQTACASFDKKTVKEALNALKQKPWPRSIKEQLNAIKNHLLHSEFDEAAAKAKEAYPG
jgi:hypothetical protein